MDLGKILSELRKERDGLNRAIAALEGITGPLRRTSKTSGKASIASTKTATKRRKGISAAGRKRISEAMKKRWQERRAKVTAVRRPAKAA
jgi:hypothetical protein